MNYPPLKPLLIVSLALAVTDMAAVARVLAPGPQPDALASRLEVADDDSSLTCWESLYELQSCTGEVVSFLLNGATDLGPECCDAIHFIQHQCWPALLGSLGFTPQEGDLLRGYCDASEASSASHHSPPPPEYI